jgi:hypothetical protein
MTFQGRCKIFRGGAKRSQGRCAPPLKIRPCSRCQLPKYAGICAIVSYLFWHWVWVGFELVSLSFCGAVLPIWNLLVSPHQYLIKYVVAVYSIHTTIKTIGTRLINILEVRIGISLMQVTFSPKTIVHHGFNKPTWLIRLDFRKPTTVSSYNSIFQLTGFTGLRVSLITRYHSKQDY